MTPPSLWGCAPLDARLSEAACEVNRARGKKAARWERLHACRSCPGVRALGDGPHAARAPRIDPPQMGGLPQMGCASSGGQPGGPERKAQPPRNYRIQGLRPPQVEEGGEEMAARKKAAAKAPPAPSNQQRRFPCGHGRTGPNVKVLEDGERVCRRCTDGPPAGERLRGRASAAAGPGPVAEACTRLFGQLTSAEAQQMAFKAAVERLGAGAQTELLGELLALGEAA